MSEANNDNLDTLSEAHANSPVLLETNPDRVAGEDGEFSETSLHPGGSIIGNYELIELIGEGAMGRVYLANHLKLDRRVALKRLRGRFSKDKDACRRFFDEARAVNRIQHVNIIQVTDFLEEERSYIMELLEGMTLTEAMKGGAMPLDRTLRVMTQTASALATVHKAKIVHRDLKPDNIYLERGDGGDHVKVLDFGVAKLAGENDMSATQVGTLLGTPKYMAPEQLGGKPVDEKADIYAFGLILYEMITGASPFEETSIGDMYMARAMRNPKAPATYEDLPDPVPAELDELIMQCLQASPAKRPESMASVHRTLAEMEARLAAGIVLPIAPTRGGPNPLLAIAGLSIIVALGAITYVALTHRAAPLPPPPEPVEPLVVETAPPPVATPAATIENVAGTLKWMPPGGTWQDGASDHVLPAGTRVRTEGAGTFAWLRLTNGTVIQLASGTELELSSEDGGTRHVLRRGTVQLLSDDDKQELHLVTSDGKMSVYSRGGPLVVSGGVGRLTVHNLGGTVALASGGETVNVKKGSQSTALAGSTPTKPASKTIAVLKVNKPARRVQGAYTTVTGVAEPGSTVTAGGVEAVVGPDGRFKVRVPLQVGVNRIAVVTRDVFGNEEIYQMPEVRRLSEEEIRALKFRWDEKKGGATTWGG